MAEIVPISALNLASISQRLARLDHYFQARFRNRFGPLVQKLAADIPAGGLVLDVGANHGKFARAFAKLHGGNVEVWAFEPFTYNYTLLESVTAGLGNVRVFRVGLSDSVGSVDLFVPFKRKSKRIAPGSAHIGLKEGAEKQEVLGTHTAPDVARVTIQTERLDDLVAREKPSSVDFLKVDVEGAEGLVFRGGRETLARFKPAVYCELMPGCPENVGMTVEGVIHELTSLGYEMYAFPEDADKPRKVASVGGFEPTCRDYLFRHPGRGK